MTPERASVTATFVAAARGLGVMLPEDARLIEDRFGLRLAGRLGRTLVRSRRVSRMLAGIPPVARWLLYMQVRTRLLDDILLEFRRGGGRQVLILGAGFDCRAARFERELDGAQVYEVDHPATQRRKRDLVGDAGRATYLPWDFEARPLAELPDELAGHGHDRREPTLTIWEGVTMYLTEPAIEATVSAVKTLSAPGSPFAFTYFEPRMIRKGLAASLVSRLGEPWRFGWDPAALPAWLAARGFTLERDRTGVSAARDLLPPAHAKRVTEPGRHIALARA